MGSCWADGYQPLRPLHNRKWVVGVFVLVFGLLVFQTMNYMSFTTPARVVSEAESSRPSLDDLFPVMLPDRNDLYQNENNKEMRALIQCMKEESCPENRKSVVLLSASHFGAMLLGFTSGEHIWYVVVSLMTQGSSLNLVLLQG